MKTIKTPGTILLNLFYGELLLLYVFGINGNILKGSCMKIGSILENQKLKKE